MKSYAEREIFGTYAVAIWEDAVWYVGRVSTSWGSELRCHELARAAHRALLADHADRLRTWKVALAVVDGLLGPIEHSWITYEVLGQPYRGVVRDVPRAHVLDVYCPGRLPQVQLIDGSSTISREYRAGTQYRRATAEHVQAEREDINKDLVEALFREMTRSTERPSI